MTKKTKIKWQKGKVVLNNALNNIGHYGHQHLFSADSYGVIVESRTGSGEFHWLHRSRVHLWQFCSFASFGPFLVWSRLVFNNYQDKKSNSRSFVSSPILSFLHLNLSLAYSHFPENQIHRPVRRSSEGRLVVVGVNQLALLAPLQGLARAHRCPY